MTRTHLLAIAALSLLLSAAPAQARTPSSGTYSSSGSGLSSLSVWGVFDPGPVDGGGLGLRLAFPIVPQGILHARVRDELVLEVGADFLHYSDRVGYYPYYVDYSWNGFLGVAGLAWNFWLTPHFALYPKLDMGWWTGWYRGWNGQYGYGRPGYDGFFVQGAAGLIYRLQSRVDLRMELGSGLFRLGVGFPF